MSRRAVFVDRDGTIIVEKGYLGRPDGVEMIDGAVEALRVLQSAGFVIVVVTNQAGIAHGFYSREDYQAVALRFVEELEAAGVVLDGMYFCPHQPNSCDCRKPSTGMYLRAQKELDIDLVASFYIGDKITDVKPGLALGGQAILVRTGYGHESELDIPDNVRAVEDLSEASCVIIEEMAGRAIGF
ncbi:MAG: D,D-heptose 1,7-bisphosphate phosphatase [Rhodospirillaceae bacterium]|nr:D,D-heptose 1,7-bisphosphate phosphatase [Rhodospirillaceae bacterium]